MNLLGGLVLIDGGLGILEQEYYTNIKKYI